MRGAIDLRVVYWHAPMSRDEVASEGEWHARCSGVWTRAGTGRTGWAGHSGDRRRDRGLPDRAPAHGSAHGADDRGRGARGPRRSGHVPDRHQRSGAGRRRRARARLELREPRRAVGRRGDRPDPRTDGIPDRAQRGGRRRRDLRAQRGRPCDGGLRRGATARRPSSRGRWRWTSTTGARCCCPDARPTARRWWCGRRLARRPWCPSRRPTRPASSRGSSPPTGASSGRTTTSRRRSCGR